MCLSLLSASLGLHVEHTQRGNSFPARAPRGASLTSSGIFDSLGKIIVYCKEESTNIIARTNKIASTIAAPDKQPLSHAVYKLTPPPSAVAVAGSSKSVAHTKRIQSCGTNDAGVPAVYFWV